MESTDTLKDKNIHIIDETTLMKTITDFFKSKLFSRIIGLIIFTLLLPLIFLLMITALLYKHICYNIIKKQDKYFAGFLDSLDVLWCLEDGADKTIVNVFGTVKSESSDKIVDALKSNLRRLIDNADVAKAFYRRHKMFGCCYWRKHNDIEIDQYVKLIDLSNVSDTVTFEELQETSTEIANQPLPYDNTGLFQILITKQKIANVEDEIREYGMFVKFHHSIGDGVAILDFTCFIVNPEEALQPNNLFSASFNSYTTKPTTSLSRSIWRLCKLPICIIDNFIRKIDDNSLHGPNLQGNNLFKWIDPDVDLLSMVKEIKDSGIGLNFSEVLLTALTRSLEIYYLRTNNPVPKDVTAALLVRFLTSSTESAIKLNNGFSIIMLELPTGEKNKMYEIKTRCDKLRECSCALSNYYFMKSLGACFPYQILRPVMYPTQHTLAFSIMPGPKYLSISNAHLISRLVFFTPNVGLAGVGITALTYGGVLRFAAKADTALVAKREDLGLILDGMVEEIKLMHKKHVAI